MDEARLPGAQNLGHPRRVDVLMHVLRVIWLKQLGELLAGVVHEVVECLQARQYDQVFGEELLPQVVPGDGRVNDYAPHAKYPPGTGLA